MGKKKTTTTQSNTYGYVPYQNTQDTNAARALISEGADFSSPIINAYGRAENDIEEQGFEDDLPSGVKDRVKASQMFDLNMRRGTDLSQAKMNEHQYKTGNTMALAGMTQNPFVQTGGTSTQVTPFNWGSLAQSAITGGATVAGGALA